MQDDGSPPAVPAGSSSRATSRRGTNDARRRTATYRPTVPAATPTALLIDFGGVLTTDVFASFAAGCEADGLAP